MTNAVKALGLAAGLTLAVAGPVAAADLYSPPVVAPAPVATPIFSWDGHYVGIQGGGYWGDGDGAIAGLYGGWNWQQNWLVLGLDLNANYAFGDDDGFQGNIRGRAGIAHDRLLFYGTAGLAGIDTDSDFEAGYTLGSGVEYAHTDTSSIRLDYAFTDTDSVDDHTLMLGIAFRGWGLH